MASEAIAANDFSEEYLRKYEDYIEETLGSGYKIQEYLRSIVFDTEEHISEFIDYSIENFTDVQLSGGDGMAKFVHDVKGFVGSSKSAYSK